MIRQRLLVSTCSNRDTSPLLTFFLLLGHDGVAERQQPEEGVDLWVLQLHRLHQGVVVEHEAWVSQRVEGEVHRFCVLLSETQKVEWSLIFDQTLLIFC